VSLTNHLAIIGPVKFMDSEGYCKLSGGRGWRLTGPIRGPEETPPSPRQPGPVRGAGETRGSGTETTRPSAMSRKRRGPPGQPGGSNPRRKRRDAVKRPTPAEQGPQAMRAARSLRGRPLSRMPPQYRRRVTAAAPAFSGRFTHPG